MYPAKSKTYTPPNDKYPAYHRNSMFVLLTNPHIFNCFGKMPNNGPPGESLLEWRRNKQYIRQFLKKIKHKILRLLQDQA